MKTASKYASSNRAYYSKNRDKILLSRRVYYAENKEEIAAKRKLNNSKHGVYRRENLKKHFNITPEEYDNIFNSQNGLCAICSKKCTTGKMLAVDHDHDTGKVRGLLCSRCNMGIGLLRDSIDILRSAINYLERSTT